MAEFDEYEYLEKTVDGAGCRGPAHHSGDDGANGREEGDDERRTYDERDRGRQYDEEEDPYEEERRMRRRSRSIEGGRSRSRGGGRERDVDDGPPGVAPVRERDRSRERDEGERERREYRPRDTFRDRDRDGFRDRDRDGLRDRDFRDRRDRYEYRRNYRDRDYDRRGRDGDGYRSRREKEEKDEPEADPERDQRTVFAYQINLKADERDVYEFFSRAGKVRDVRLIMDRNSRRSKGVGYIEFYDALSVPMAIALRGQLLLGTPVMVKPSEAEKNLAAQAAAALPAAAAVPGVVPGLPGAGLLLPSLAAGSRRLHIGNLHVNMNEEQLKQVVEPFGALELVQVPTDAATGQCKGFGYVQYAKIEDARIAQQYLNDMDLAGLKIKVQFIPENFPLADSGPPVNPGELDDDEGGGLSLNSHSRAALMQKLDRSATGPAAVSTPAPALPALGLLAANPLAAAVTGLRPGILPPGLGLPTVPALPALLPALPGAPRMPALPLPTAPAAALAAAPALENFGTPSPCLLLKNMFSFEELDDDFARDVEDDVDAECAKFGKVLKVHVDRVNPGGFVYVKFEEVSSASDARKALHNRWFAGKHISATFMEVGEFEKKLST